MCRVPVVLLQLWAVKGGGVESLCIGSYVYHSDVIVLRNTMLNEYKVVALTITKGLLHTTLTSIAVILRIYI